MPQCVIKSCKNNARKRNFTAGVSYFRFPGNPFTCQEWISVVARANEEHFYKPAKNSVICSEHFDKVDISGNTKRQRLVKTAVPKLQIQPPSKDLQIAKPNTEPSLCDEVLPLSYSFVSNIRENATHNQDQVDHVFDNTSVDASVSDLISVIGTPRKSFLEKQLLTAGKIIDSKTKKIQTLEERNNVSDKTTVDASVSDLKSDIGTPRKSFLKKQLLTAGKIIDSETKKIQTLQKRNINVLDNTSVDASVSDLISVIETPEISFLKKQLLTARKIIKRKTEKIQTLQKINKRLIKKKSSLKSMIDLLKKKKQKT